MNPLKISWDTGKVSEEFYRKISEGFSGKIRGRINEKRPAEKSLNNYWNS